MVAIAALLNKILTQIPRVGGTGTGGGRGGKTPPMNANPTPRRKNAGCAGEMVRYKDNDFWTNEKNVSTRLSWWNPGVYDDLGSTSSADLVS